MCSLDTAHPGLILATAARMMGIQAMVFFTFGELDIIKEKRIQGLDIPDSRELIETLDAAGTDLFACKMDMDMFGLEQKDLVPEVTDVIGTMDFFQHAEGAQRLFILEMQQCRMWAGQAGRGRAPSWPSSY